MSGPDALSQTLGTLLLALAFSAFILFVRGYRPAGVGAFWYDLVLGFVGLWLALWPEAATFLHEMNAASALGLLLQVVATLLGGLLSQGPAVRPAGAPRRAPGRRRAPRALEALAQRLQRQPHNERRRYSR
ncbi:hypothetical protein [Pseudomonas citronellolis]|uniref:hypothetical protein n=1 Tax=Pseudomonas citronellolis TaxID=53408 RepID=UPI00248DA2F3|nr:hypothetical protein [Pseudomonas citronellolis]